ARRPRVAQGRPASPRRSSDGRKSGEGQRSGGIRKSSEARKSSEGGRSVDGARSALPKRSRQPEGRTLGVPRRPNQAEGRRAPRADTGLGGEQVEGRRAVLELLSAGRRRVRDLWVSDSVDESEVITAIMELAATARVPVRRVGRARLDAEARTEAPQGVLAHAVGLEETPLEDLAQPGREGRLPFLVVLDQITDPHNLGTLLRSAEACGATGVVLPRHRSAHVTPTVAKAAAGAVEYLPMALVPGIPAALAELAKIGIWSLGLDPEASTSVFDLSLADGPVALVMGAEGQGLSRLARQRCDVLASIPQVGRIQSLNVSAAGAVAMFEIARRRGLSDHVG
ncbi:MAG: 23S rRNA (guanosine(2251)-2'-O)-methyltransferase RlmB, partial [Acidimicrobiales bacterium]